MTPFKDEAIYELYPNAERVINGATVLDSSGNEISIDDSLVNAKMVEMQADYDSKQYARDRAVAYPSIQEQLDMQYWDSVNGTTTWKDAIEAVKTEHPKP